MHPEGTLGELGGSVLDFSIPDPLMVPGNKPLAEMSVSSVSILNVHVFGGDWD